MKTVLLFLIACFLLHPSHAQDIQKPFLINEFHISINRTNVADATTENGLGYGFGAYHVANNTKKVNFVFGVELNRNSQFKKSFGDKFTSFSNVRFTMNYLSFPLIVRFNIIKPLNSIFFEGGPFVDVYLFGREKGNYTTTIFQNNTSGVINVDSYSRNNFGVSFGFGIKLALEKYFIILKQDYKYGFLPVKSDAGFSMTNSYYCFSLGLLRK
jgi:hypothetical protein